MGYAGGRTQRGDLVLSAERSIYAMLGLFTIASAGVMNAFLTDRFEYWYVASYSNADLELFYKITGLWAGQRGSLLFWAAPDSRSSPSLAVWQNRAQNREFMPYVAASCRRSWTFFVVVLLFAEVNPFERLDFTQVDGQGLNPQLQNYWMTIHPPTLYLGFTAFTIPFAFAAAALLNGRLDARWIQLTRRWILTSWLFLSVGIVFGMRWAYEELGWGGVLVLGSGRECIAPAVAHGDGVPALDPDSGKKRGMLKVWNMALVLMTFTLTIFATLSHQVRDHRISPHLSRRRRRSRSSSWASSGVVIGSCVVLILYRLPTAQEREPDRVVRLPGIGVLSSTTSSSSAPPSR